MCTQSFENVITKWTIASETIAFFSSPRSFFFLLKFPFPWSSVMLELLGLKVARLDFLGLIPPNFEH